MLVASLFLLGLGAIVTADNIYELKADFNVLSSNVLLPYDSSLEALNSNFKLTYSTSAQRKNYPLSFGPIFFTGNPEARGNIGFSLGHTTSDKTMEVRMSCGPSCSGGVHFDKFTYKTPLQLVDRNTFELSCANTNAGRVCSLVVNGEQASPASMLLPVVRAPITLAGRNGLFGDVWGWRFFGVFHGVRIEPGAVNGCTHYGDVPVSNPLGISYDKNKVVDFRCATTVTTTTVTQTTLTTVTTNTIAQEVSRYRDHLGDLRSNTDDVVDVLNSTIGFLQNELAATNAKANALQTQLSTSNAHISNLQDELSALKSSVYSLRVKDMDNTGTSLCESVPVDGSDNVAPTIETSSDGTSLTIAACGGSISLSSKECAFDPCLVQQDVREIRSKLDALTPP